MTDHVLLSLHGQTVIAFTMLQALFPGWLIGV